MYISMPQAAASRRSRGFSLVELLVVIAVMSILMTVGAIGIGGMTGGKSMSSAVATSESFFDEARGVAVANNTRARVLVDVDDPDNLNTYLRRLIIVYEKTNDQGVPVENEWVLLNRGLTLPNGVFYSREYSRKDTQGGAGQLDVQDLAGGEVKRDYQGKYVYYEFNSEGICTSPGASFIIGAGARQPGAESPMVTASGKLDFGGFVIWRNGRTSVVKSPEQIGLPENVKKF